jgi:hypothetical protein
MLDKVFKVTGIIFFIAFTFYVSISILIFWAGFKFLVEIALIVLLVGYGLFWVPDKIKRKNKK